MAGDSNTAAWRGRSAIAHSGHTFDQRPECIGGNENAGSAVRRRREVLDARILGPGNPHSVLTESLHQAGTLHPDSGLAIRQDAPFIRSERCPSTGGGWVTLPRDREPVQTQLDIRCAKREARSPGDIAGNVTGNVGVFDNDIRPSDQAADAIARRWRRAEAEHGRHQTQNT
jgi:hypothetical protein